MVRRIASARKLPTKNPKGGLTAARREEFHRKQGSYLKPGVKKSPNEMSPDEMKRKGSWASRFYGRAKLPALKYKNGKPTRFALTAAAWGEPVPKSEAAARRIADKGHKLLERYHRGQALAFCGRCAISFWFSATSSITTAPPSTDSTRRRRRVDERDAARADARLVPQDTHCVLLVCDAALSR